MTGPWHYREAERLLAGLPDVLRHEPGQAGYASVLWAAQVHATLALAAATAELDLYTNGMIGRGTGRTDEESRAWASVLTDTKTGGRS